MFYKKKKKTTTRKLTDTLPSIFTLKLIKNEIFIPLEITTNRG